MDLEKEKDRVRSEQGITGCEHCKHFVETQGTDKKPGWRQYCGLGNFNINRASFKVEQNTHGKNVCRTQDYYEWEFGIPNRCPLLRQKELK